MARARAARDARVIRVARVERRDEPILLHQLIYRGQVFAEIFRVLKPWGVCIVSFSNRMFYEKAISAWRDGMAYSRVQLVTQYFQCVEGFTQPEVIRKLPSARGGGSRSSPLDAVMRFYAVISYRNLKPV